MKCKNCGAELNNGKCEYCGAIFFEDMYYLPIVNIDEDVLHRVIHSSPVLTIDILSEIEPIFTKGD